MQISPLSANLLITCTELGAREAPGGIRFLAPPRMLIGSKVGILKEFTGKHCWSVLLGPSFLDQNNW